MMDWSSDVCPSDLPSLAARILVALLGIALLLGAQVAAPPGAAAAPVAAAVPEGDEPGMTMRVFQVPYNLSELCTLKAGQTPNVDELKQTINWTTAADFGGFEDKFLTQAIAPPTAEQHGPSQFRPIGQAAGRA